MDKHCATFPRRRTRSIRLAKSNTLALVGSESLMGREVRDVAPESLERLRAYNWPGNVRELQSVLKQALLRASGGGWRMRPRGC